MNLIKIKDRLVGENKPTFIIAEAGVNHNGDINLAKKLVDAAVEAGADAIKFQTFKAEDIATEQAGMAEYQKKNTGKEEGQIDLLKRLEFDERIKGGHHIFTQGGIEEVINLQSKGGKAKPYQVKQVRGLILAYKLGGYIHD